MVPATRPAPMKSFIQITVFLLAIASTMWGMISVHAKTPHDGAVTQSEMSLTRELIKSEFKQTRREIDQLRQEIIGLRKMGVTDKQK